MVAIDANGGCVEWFERDSISQVYALHHHYQFVEAIGATSNDFQVEIDFGVSKKGEHSRFKGVLIRSVLPIANSVAESNPFGNA